MISMRSLKLQKRKSSASPVPPIHPQRAWLRPDSGCLDKVTDRGQLTILDLEEDEVAHAAMLSWRPREGRAEACVIVDEVVVQCLPQAFTGQVLSSFIECIGEE